MSLTSVGEYVRSIYTSPAAGPAGGFWDQVIRSWIHELASSATEGSVQRYINKRKIPRKFDIQATDSNAA